MKSEKVRIEVERFRDDDGRPVCGKCQLDSPDICSACELRVPEDVLVPGEFCPVWFENDGTERKAVK